MTEDNLTAILYGVNDLRMEQTSIVEPAANEVSIRMACIGICGSDLHYFLQGKIGNFVLDRPLIMGHESSGTVVRKGKGVKNLEIGDRVAIEPGIPCGTCGFCKSGHYNLCMQVKFCATPPVHGSLRRYYNHAADFCFKIPDYVSLEEAALLEPLSVAVHTCKKVGVGIQSSVLILGAGTIGLAALLVAKAMGAKTVVISDLQEFRLNIAKKLCADGIYLIKDHYTEKENIQNIKTLFDVQPNITIDASGAESSVRLSILITQPGGTIGFVGMGSHEVEIPVFEILSKELNIKGIFRYANDYLDALDLVAKKKVDIKSIITHRYKLEDTLEAFEMAKSIGKDVIKVIIQCN